ncbi:MAG: hypothetical protein VKJ64_02695, partial [Leptolyngbyaceae bacterium]|nr:hypothetical protein [Leptolyngbyaceae bacterium]
MSQLTPQPSNVASSRPRTASMAITPTQSAVPTPAKGQTAAILHPALQNALDCLDVDLDEELSRYRRHCLIQQRVTRRRNAHGTGTQGRSGATPLPPPTVLATATAQPALSGALTGTMVASAVTTGVMDGAAPSHAISDHPQSQPSDNPDDYLESS